MRGHQPARPVGGITRGTTHPNRLRRLDSWLVHATTARLRHDPQALVVDLGFGAVPTTTLELADRLRATLGRPVPVLGLDIDPGRVRAAHALARDSVTFAVGGFEIPVPPGRRPVVIRAANVLRQYEEAQVWPAWAQMAGRLAEGGVLVDCTCDELGRLGSWVAIGRDAAGRPVPRTLTLSMRLAPNGPGDEAGVPSRVAERLPKALIHRNVPGEPVHALLADLDRAWASAAPRGAFGLRQRWIEAVGRLRASGWPVQDGPTRWRLGELTVAWEAVAPNA